MTQPTNPGNEPDPSLNSPRRSRRRKILLGTGGAILVGTIGGVGYGWFFIQRQLSPLIAENLTKSLDRPVNLGPVEGFSPGKIRFGTTEIPPTPTEDNQASLEAIEISFNLIPLVLNRRLDISASLIEPEVKITQARDGNWLPNLPESEGESAIEVQLGEIKVKDAQITLIARDTEERLKPPLELTLPSTNLRFQEENTVIEVETAGSLGQGGQFQLGGTVQSQTQQAKLNLLAHEIQLVQITNLVELPVTLESGSLSSNLEAELNYQSTDCTLFTEDCDLIRNLQGTAKIQNVAVSREGLPTDVTDTNLDLSFKETKIKVENFATVVGQIPATATGIIDLKSGVNLDAETEPITLEQIFQSLDLKEPDIPLASTLKTTVNITGTPTAPVVTGQVKTTQLTQVDQVIFKTVNSNFTFKDSTLTIDNFQAVPVVGGQLLGKGYVKLGEKGGIVFDAKAQQLPIALLAKPYGVELPLPLTTLEAQAKVFGPLDNPDQLRANLSTRLPLAGGEVRAAVNNLQLGSQRWRGTATLAGINLAQVPQLPPLIQQQGGAVNGQFNLAGRLDSFEPDTLEANGFVNVAIAGGTLQVNNLNLTQGQYRTQIVASNIPTAPFIASVPDLVSVPPQLLGNVNGQLNLAGDLDGLSQGIINGNGSLGLDVAGGTVRATNINLGQGNWNVKVQTRDVQVAQLLPEPEVNLPSRLNSDITLAGRLDDFTPGTLTGGGNVRLSLAQGTLNINNLNLNQGRWKAGVTALDIPVTSLVPGIPNELTANANATLNVAGSLTDFTPERLEVNNGNLDLFLDSGTVSATNITLSNGNWKTNLVANRLAFTPDQCASLLSDCTFLTVFDPQVTTNLTVTGNLANLSPTGISAYQNGLIAVDLKNGNIAVNNFNIVNGNWEGNVVTTASFTSQDCFTFFPQCPNLPGFDPRIDGNFNLRGNLANLTPSGISATGEARIASSQGTIEAKKVRLLGGNFSTILDSRVSLSQLSGQLSGELTSQLDIAGNLNRLTPESLEVDGNINLSEGIPILEGGLATEFQWRGQRLTLNEFTIGDQVDARGDVEVNLANSGINIIEQIDLAVEVNSLDLGQLVRVVPLPSPVNNLALDGTLGLTGNLRGNLNDPNVEGQLTLQGFSVDAIAFDDLLEGDVRFTSQGVNLDLQGDNDLIQVTLDSTYLPLTLAVRLDEVQLQGQRQGDWLTIETAREIPLNLIATVASEIVTLEGEPILLPVGEFRQNPSNQLLREIINPSAPGGAQSCPQRTKALFSDTSPQLSKPPKIFKSSKRFFPQLPLSGTLDVDPKNPLKVNLKTLEVEGSLKVSEVEIKEVLVLLQLNELNDVDQLFKPRTYGCAEDLFPLHSLPESSQSKSGLTKAGGEPGSGQNPMTKQTWSTSKQSQSRRFWDQLQRFSEIQKLLEQQREAGTSSLIPPLRNLQGTLEGTIELGGSFKGQNKLAVPKFDLTGKDWIWCENTKTGDLNCDFTPYVADSVEIRGSFQEGIVTLLPVKLDLAEGGFIGLDGTFLGETQTGKLILRDIPTDLIAEILRLPPLLDIVGKIDGDITLGGEAINPNIKGTITLKEGKIEGNRRTSDTQVELAQGNLSYSNSVLNIYFRSILEDDLAVSAENPPAFTVFLKFPFQIGSVPPKPEDNQVILNLAKERTTHLALLSIVTAGELEWLGGEGEISLDIQSSLPSGESLNLRSFPETLEQLSQGCLSILEGEENTLSSLAPAGDAGSDRCLTVDGRIVLNKTSLQPLFLSDPITDITGTIGFNLDELTIQNLTGIFGGGEINITGGLPLYQPNADQTLQVTLPQLAIALKGLYNGNVDRGAVTIAGTALEPKIRGEIDLANGQVLLPSSSSSSSSSQTRSGGEEPRGGFQPQFDGIKLVLKDNIQITQPPLLNFLATGSLTLGGRVNNPVPKCDRLTDCEITLQRGQVNLFTTQFRLDRGHRNIAQFVPGQGLDPLLDVRLNSSVTEANRQLIGADPTSAEVNDADNSNFGSTQTIRVQARYNGLASNLQDVTTDKLELVSSPPRSETELVALLGGSFIQTFTEDATLGLANLAGNTFLGTFQNALRDAWGLGEFRLFPTSVIEENEGERTSSLGLGAEIGIDISNDFSLSAIKVLTTDQPFQYGIRYRLNDYTILRGSTDFSGDNRATVEYEIRF